MDEKKFVPLIEGQLDPEAERRTSITILALTHPARVVRLDADFAERDDHLRRAQEEVRAHFERYQMRGPQKFLPIVAYRYFPAPDWGYLISTAGEVLGTFRGRPIRAGVVVEGGVEIGYGLPEEDQG